MIDDMPEPESEEEEEEEEEEDEEEEEEEDEGRALVSPELQILTPSYMIGYLNSVATLLQTGVSGSHCGGGYETIGVSTFRYSGGVEYKICPKGLLTWPGASSPEKTLVALDVLLTGGRLTEVMRETIQNAAMFASADRQIQVAQQAIALSAEFNSFGDPLPLPVKRE